VTGQISKTKNSTALTIITLLIAVQCYAQAQTKVQAIDSLMSTVTQNGQFNGAVLVAEHGSVIYKKGFGYANMELKVPNQPDTKFRLGSITKQFTATLILKLAEQGKLKLDGKVSDYLPQYSKTNGSRITIHELLTHSSGIPNYTDFPNFFRERARDPVLPDEFTKVFADSALRFEPGTKFSYSNSGYFLLGVIIEKVTGKPYDQVLRENIFAPLGMKNSGYDHSRDLLANRAAGYEKDVSQYVNADYVDMSIPYSAGALYSTVEDLYLWDQALYTDTPLSEASKQIMFAPQIPAMGRSYGYGWFVGKSAEGKSSDSITTISHGGRVNGFNSLIFRIPQDKPLVVLLHNGGVAPLEVICQAITGILYGKPYTLPKKSVAEAVLAATLERGSVSGLQLFRDLTGKQADSYSVREDEMNAAGYRLLQMGKTKEAIVIFKLNVGAFPESSNVYDSLGEAYMANGDRDLAITNYEMSVKLNPNNVNGIDRLKRLRNQ